MGEQRKIHPAHWHWWPLRPCLNTNYVYKLRLHYVYTSQDDNYVYMYIVTSERDHSLVVTLLFYDRRT